MSNLISLYGAVKVDGRYLVNETFLQDCTPANIVSVMPCTFPNAEGTNVDGFWIRYQNPMGLVIEDIYLAENPDLLDLDEFLTGLGVVSATNKFTKYTTLLRGSDIAEGLVPSGTNMLINDIYTQGRAYNPDDDETFVKVTAKNRLSYTQYVFDGDQTYAGSYQYFTDNGNA
jgi:hypothetical protein